MHVPVLIQCLALVEWYPQHPENQTRADEQSNLIRHGQLTICHRFKLTWLCLEQCMHI